MLVERIWAANDLRNFHYLIACSQTGEALIVDPLDARQCLETARQHGFTITQVLNTHEHLDHTAGNAEVVAATRAPRAGACRRREAASVASTAGWRAAMSSRWAARSSSKRSTHPGIPARTFACWPMAMRRPCSAETRCSMPAPEIATMAAIRACCTKPS